MATRVFSIIFKQNRIKNTSLCKIKKMAPVNLLGLNNRELKAFLDSFDHVFSDCDGVIWTGAGPIQGSGDFFKLMKKHGKTVHYVSNNSLRTKENYVRLFYTAGIENGYEYLTIPSTAIAEYLESVNFNKDKKIYSVSCPQTTKVIESYGFKCETGPDICADNYAEYLQYLKDDADIGAVVFDSDFKINLPKLYRARSYLKRPEVLFINGATDKYLGLKPGQLDLGVGAFTDVLVELIKRDPIQLGKPGRDYGEFAMKKAGVTDASRVLFIGDMIDQDIGLGKATGFKTLLVLTNISEETMMAHPVQTDFYAPSLGSLVPKL